MIIDDGNGYRSIYAHFSKIVVKVGQQVRAGQLIGYEGRTGRASGCHLHYGLFSTDEPGRFAIEASVVQADEGPGDRDRAGRPAARPATQARQAAEGGAEPVVVAGPGEAAAAPRPPQRRRYRRAMSQ